MNEFLHILCEKHPKTKIKISFFGIHSETLFFVFSLFPHFTKIYVHLPYHFDPLPDFLGQQNIFLTF